MIWKQSISTKNIMQTVGKQRSNEIKDYKYRMQTSCLIYYDSWERKPFYSYLPVLWEYDNCFLVTQRNKAKLKELPSEISLLLHQREKVADKYNDASTVSQ